MGLRIRRTRTDPAAISSLARGLLSGWFVPSREEDEEDRSNAGPVPEPRSPTSHRASDRLNRALETQGRPTATRPPRGAGL